MSLLAWLGPFSKKLLDGISAIVAARKDLIQTEESKLKVDKLEAEKRERESRISEASLTDVEKYDPKHAALIKAIRDVNRHCCRRIRGDSDAEDVARSLWISLFKRNKASAWWRSPRRPTKHHDRKRGRDPRRGHQVRSPRGFAPVPRRLGAACKR